MIAALVLLLQAASIAAIENGPPVVKAASPSYPVVARKARMYGRTVVELVVSGNGRVSAAMAEGPNPLLAKAAEEAARAWRFTASPEEESRCATLVFDFELAGDPVEDPLVVAYPESPFSLRVTASPYPVIITILEDPISVPCLIVSEPGSTTFCERALQILPLH